MTGLSQSDQEAAAVAKTLNRVSLADIEAQIALTRYVTGEDMLTLSGGGQGDLSDEIIKRLRVVTVCAVVMRNGFVQLGSSSPADPDNFNADLGRKFAREDAIRKLWPVLGYEMCTKVSAELGGTNG